MKKAEKKSKSFDRVCFIRWRAKNKFESSLSCQNFEITQADLVQQSFDYDCTAESFQRQLQTCGGSVVQLAGQ